MTVAKDEADKHANEEYDEVSRVAERARLSKLRADSEETAQWHSNVRTGCKWKIPDVGASEQATQRKLPGARRSLYEAREETAKVTANK